MRDTQRIRGALAGLLASTLIAGSVMLASPAAYAEEPVAQDPASVQLSEDAPATGEDAPSAPEDDAPVSEPEEAPEAELPQTDDPLTEPQEDPEAPQPETAEAPAASAPAAASEEFSATPKITGATAKGLTIDLTVTRTGGDGAALELQAAVLPEGRAEGAQEPDCAVRADLVANDDFDEFAAVFEAPAAKLDRTKQYEVAVWPADSRPTAETLLAVEKLDVTKGQWDAVFPPKQDDWNAKAAVGSLDWGVKKSFREYIRGPIAHGAIMVTKPATGKDLFKFPQLKNTWDPGTESGTVSFTGNVNFKGHYDDWYEKYALYLDLRNPQIVVKSNGDGEIRVVHEKKDIAIAAFTLSSGKKVPAEDGSIRYTGIKTTLTKAGADSFFVNNSGQGPKGIYKEGDALDDLSFTVGGDRKDSKPTKPNENENEGNGKNPKPTTPVTPTTPATGAQAAGSLRWGVSSYFSAYTTQKSNSAGCPTPSKHCAGGEIVTSGVGAGWLFPQAAGSSWNAASQTGTVQFSGNVSFNGYGMTMFHVTNPSITVTGPTTATLNTGYSGSYGPSSVPLDLGSAQKSVGAGGEVTWSNVPVQGGLSGISAGQSSGFDSLSFTVGTASNVSYGSTQAGATTQKRTPAATPPATTGITVVTPADKLRAGGRIEIEASGFDPGDTGVLVVLYSDPIVLDESATADERGVVRWTGTLPKDVTGTHTITLQGSTDAGAVIKILDPAKKAKASAKDLIAPSASQADGGTAQQAAVVAVPTSGMALWEWWASAAGLVLIAACTTTLAIRQRRSN